MIAADLKSIIVFVNDRRMTSLAENTKTSLPKLDIVFFITIYGAKKMNNIKRIERIAIIGATGKLALPVMEELAKEFQLRAVVRDVERAKQLLPKIELMQADLQDVSRLTSALQGMDAVYINVNTETVHLRLPFYAEREGIANIIEAARASGIQAILKIGALGTLPNATHLRGENAVPNLIRIQGHRLIEESGIPFTIFHPSFFMENLWWNLKGIQLQWIGNAPSKYYWIAAADYAKQVRAAINLPQTRNRHYAIQGAQALSADQAIEQFIAAYGGGIKKQVLPLGIAKLIGLFDPKMQFAAHMFSYFGRQSETFYAEQTWQELGVPSITMEDFARSKMREIRELAI